MSITKPEENKSEKILKALYRLAGGTTRPVRYEDIVVKAFKLFPAEFQLRGYPKYPDATDVNKPLYGSLKRGEFVLSGGKMFRLTEKGLSEGAALWKGEHGKKSSTKRATRDVLAEVDRIRRTTAFRHFATGRPEQILDSDFYAYLGVTVKTEKNAFLGRLKSVESAITNTAIKAGPHGESLGLLHAFLKTKFQEIIRTQTTH